MLLLFRSLEVIDWVMIVSWGIIFIITLIIELETMDLVTVWFCLSALITLILGVLFLKPLQQILFFLGFSVLLIDYKATSEKKNARKLCPNQYRSLNRYGCRRYKRNLSQSNRGSESGQSTLACR